MSAAERYGLRIEHQLSQIRFCPFCGSKVNWFGNCAMGCDGADDVLEQMRMDAMDAEAAADDRALLIDRDEEN